MVGLQTPLGMGIRTLHLKVYPPWRWMVGIQSFFGQWEGLSSVRAPCQFYTIFSQGEPSRSPTSSTTMPPWPHVTCSGKKWWVMKFLAGGLKYVLFSPLFEEDFQFDEHIFQMGWNHQAGFGFRIFLNRLLVLGVRVFFHFLCEGTLVPFFVGWKSLGVVKIWGGDFVAYTLED